MKIMWSQMRFAELMAPTVDYPGQSGNTLDIFPWSLEQPVCVWVSVILDLLRMCLGKKDKCGDTFWYIQLPVDSLTEKPCNCLQ